MPLMHRSDVRPATLSEHLAGLAKCGKHPVSLTRTTYWQKAERWTMERYPLFALEEPSREEVRAVFARSRAAVITYARPVDAAHPQNAWLYICSDKNYSLGKLNAKRRANVRRALRELSFNVLNRETFLAHGGAVYADSRQRLGLSDDTETYFQAKFHAYLDNPSHHVVGAWRDGRLAAFMYIEAVEDQALIGIFAMAEFLRFKPNNGLVHVALEGLLAEGGFRHVCYGMSSIQADSNAEGLHDFKVKMGFEARAVHREFVFQPLLRLLVNRYGYWALRGIGCLAPRNTAIRKAVGVMGACLGYSAPMDFSQSATASLVPMPAANGPINGAPRGGFS